MCTSWETCFLKRLHSHARGGCCKASRLFASHKHHYHIVRRFLVLFLCGCCLRCKYRDSNHHHHRKQQKTHITQNSLLTALPLRLFITQPEPTKRKSCIVDEKRKKQSLFVCTFLALHKHKQQQQQPKNHISPVQLTPKTTKRPWGRALCLWTDLFLMTDHNQKYLLIFAMG